MANRSPMSYFIDAKAKEPKLSKVSKKKSSKPDFEDAYKRHARMQGEICNIEGYPTVTDKLLQWNDRQVLKWIRKEAGLVETRTLPEILFVTGNGMKNVAYNHMAHFCWQTGFLPIASVNYYNVNKFVKHWVADSEIAIEDAFDSSRSRMIRFYGFDELIANPRPPMADWYDWVDIITNMILDKLDKYNFNSPVIFDLSHSSREMLVERFDRLQSFQTEILHIPRLKPDYLARYITKDMQIKNYVVSASAQQSIDRLLAVCAADKDCRTVSEKNLTETIVKTILDKQGERLRQMDAEDITKAKVKSIRREDIPKQVVFANSQVIFY